MILFDAYLWDNPGRLWPDPGALDLRFVATWTATSWLTSDKGRMSTENPFLS